MGTRLAWIRSAYWRQLQGPPKNWLVATEGADAAVRMGGHLGKNVSQSDGRWFKSLRIMLQSTSSNSWAVLVIGYSAAGIIKNCL